MFKFSMTMRFSSVLPYETNGVCYVALLYTYIYGDNYLFLDSLKSISQYFEKVTCELPCFHYLDIKKVEIDTYK